MTEADPGEAPGRPTIRGALTFLRAAERSDIPLFVRWLNDADTAQFLNARAPLSIPLEEAWFERMVAAQGKEGFHFVICLLASGAPIGTIGLFDWDQLNGSAGMGIAIGMKALWNRGYGTDALNALLDFGFGELRLERVWLDVYEFNPRARRSYDKCGFSVEGTLRHAMFRGGRHIDLIHMSILRDEWAALERKHSWDYLTAD